MGHPEGVPAHPSPKVDAEHPGYEIQDVNVGGIITFVAGLCGFLVIFFFVCYFMGKVINTANVRDYTRTYGTPNRWAPNLADVGSIPGGGKAENLASNAETQQRQLKAMTDAFPTPRLETDDGNQDVADLHAREDLLLNFYSTSRDLPPGTIRIPIERAMQLVVQRGLPKPGTTETAASKPMFGDDQPSVTAPLTDGFARTGYELETIEARKEKVEYQEERK